MLIPGVLSIEGRNVSHLLFLLRKVHLICVNSHVKSHDFMMTIKNTFTSIIKMLSSFN